MLLLEMKNLVQNLCTSFDRCRAFHRRSGINNSVSFFLDGFRSWDVGLPAVMGAGDESEKVGRGFI